MSGDQGQDGLTFPRLKAQKRESSDVVTTSTETVSIQSAGQLGRAAVIQEYTINVPLVRPKPSFLQILHTAGAKGEVFTKKEICFYLKEYIGSRLLYDQNDPRIVHCQNDPLGLVFQVERFTINDVFELLERHCTPSPDTCIKRRRHLLSPAIQHQNRQLLFRAQQGTQSEGYHSASSSVALSISVRSQSPISSTTTTELAAPRAAPNESGSKEASSLGLTKTLPSDRTAKRKRSRGKSSSESDGRPSKRKSSASRQEDAEASGYPWYFTVKMEASDDSEVLSVQGKETVKVKDSSDDLWFMEEDEISVHIDTDDTFSVEYEVESDHDNDPTSDLSEVTSNTTEEMLVVCGDSDMEFWADSSASCSSDSDEELTDADKWKCAECDNLNTPVHRFCGRCWKLRPGWLPEFRNQTFFKRSLSAPSGLSSDDSGSIARRRRVRNKPARGRSTLGSSKRTVHPSTSHLSSISSSSSSSSRPLPTRLSASAPDRSHSEFQTDVVTAYRSEQPEARDTSVPAGLSRYDSGIGMGSADPQCSSQKSGEVNSLSVSTSPNKPLLQGRSSDVGKDVHTTNANLQSSLSEQFKDLCMICLSKPKNACIIHGKTSHQVCCYGCAKTLKKRGRTCPVCRQPIKHVTKNYLM